MTAIHSARLEAQALVGAPVETVHAFLADVTNQSWIADRRPGGARVLGALADACG